MENMETTKEQNEPKPVTRKKGRILKRILVFLLIVFLLMQLLQPDKNNNDVIAKNDIKHILAVPDSVQNLLAQACYDCHSNNTNYPWYSNIQPVAWWLSNHVEEGKGHLNFNEFTNIPPRNGKTTRQRQLKKLEEIKETIEEEEMPLTSYTLLHKEARLTKQQKHLIIQWADSAKNALSSLPEK
jgi:hypothetical protein